MLQGAKIILKNFRFESRKDLTIINIMLENLGKRILNRERLLLLIIGWKFPL